MSFKQFDEKYAGENVYDVIRGAKALTRIYDAMSGEERVKWVGDDGEIREGTVRHYFYRQDGTTTHIIGGSHVRVTMLSGLDVYLKLEEMMQMYDRADLVFKEKVTCGG